MTLEEFEEHFKNLISNNEVNGAQDSDPDETEPVYEELDVLFTVIQRKQSLYMKN